MYPLKVLNVSWCHLLVWAMGEGQGLGHCSGSRTDQCGPPMVGPRRPLFPALGDLLCCFCPVLSSGLLKQPQEFWCLDVGTDCRIGPWLLAATQQAGQKLRPPQRWPWPETQWFSIVVKKLGPSFCHSCFTCSSD